MADPVDFLLGALKQQFVEFSTVSGFELLSDGASFLVGGVVHVWTDGLQVPGDGVRQLGHRQLWQHVIFAECFGLGRQEN